MLGLNSLNFSSISTFFKLNGKVYETTSNKVYSKLYKTLVEDENEVFNAEMFGVKYFKSYLLYGCPDSFGENGIELWHELQSRFSDRRFATEHVTVYNLSEVKSLEEFEASLQ